ncbi:probable galactinol--sucrose galactosyltransferase 2 isoform X2 [Phalaenopsis equestris]|uniref:probable galactinol--sucrose galactosyltransferase 2 isoform X2 n=1 Tax=Phalaenopsis equestris TaxID=78828 RepID=UPI0009E4C44F|nr:probable galactinol--sucrose galactosyltransferase 2 isoform X2 [Phalaenopsis equestris]
MAIICSTVNSLHLEPSFAFFLPSKSNGIALNSRRLRFPETWKHSMSQANKSFIQNGVLRINGREPLSSVPENVVVTPSSNGSLFLGAVSQEASSRHIFKLGVVKDFPLLSLFRFKIWWMIPRIGHSGSDIPAETQLLLLEAKANGDESPKADKALRFYILFLPVLDGQFRSSLQGNSSNELEFCIESGDPFVKSSKFLEVVLVNYGEDPYHLVKESIKILHEKKGTFLPCENKQMPGMLDWFGWCTWDAFYHDVSPQGITKGLRSLSEGGTPAKFLIIDDGWQDVANEFQKEGEPIVEGCYFGGRLVSIRENSKFRGDNPTSEGTTNGFKDFITAIKETFGVKYVYVWHALMGYWGGVHPNAPETKKYNSKLLYPEQSPGNLANSRDLSMDCMEKYGVAMIDPNKVDEFYDDLHAYLASQNIDGVKVDVQNILETLGTGYGGRVSLTHRFQEALEKSISKNFQDNSIICCMGQSTDSIYSSKAGAVTRASDDYMPRNLTSQTRHVAAVAFNSIFLGEILVPDWDMFYSVHYAAEFHAKARALGGCGIYVSDKVNEHDFDLLKKLVLPDGSILRANYPGRPTRDCLFSDPVTDGKSLLKIWNLNKFTGILGVFNCQGAGTWPGLSGNQSNSCPEFITGQVSANDIEYLDKVAGNNWIGDCAIYSFDFGSLSRLPKNGTFGVSLKVLQCEVFTISPIKVYDKNVEFAPIGLIQMYNSGGAVEDIDPSNKNSDMVLHIEGRGSGIFGAYSSRQPKSCMLNSRQEEFKFSIADSFLTLNIPTGAHSWELDLFF